MPPRNTFAATRRSHAILKRLRRGEGVTIQQISERFGIQYPQARADLKLLEELYDLTTHRDGRIKVWKMPGAGDKATHVGMAAALELGGVALDLFKHTPYGERIDELAQEWRDRVQPAARERLRRLSMALVLRRTWLPTRREQLLEVLEQFLDSIMLKRGVDITYERSDGEIGDYLVIPRRLIWYQGRLWLQAIHDGEQKLFDVAGVLDASYCLFDKVVDRYVEEQLQSTEIQQDAETDDFNDSDDSGESQEEQEQDSSEGNGAVNARRAELEDVLTDRVESWFQYGSRAEEDAYFETAFGIFATNYEPQNVELRVYKSWANYLRRYRVHPSQQNQEIDNGLQVRFELGLCPEFKSFLLGMVPDVEVVEPDGLSRELEERIRQWIA